MSEKWVPGKDAKPAEVVPIGVEFKEPGKEQKRVLEVVYPRCFHGPFLIDPEAGEVTCKRCGEKLNPMAVLQRLANKESEYRRVAETYQEQMRRLGERSRTKCQHCGKMTRINRG